jgi:hypothetical protein
MNVDSTCYFVNGSKLELMQVRLDAMNVVRPTFPWILRDEIRVKSSSYYSNVKADGRFFVC